MPISNQHYHSLFGERLSVNDLHEYITVRVLFNHIVHPTVKLARKIKTLLPAEVSDFVWNTVYFFCKKIEYYSF